MAILFIMLINQNKGVVKMATKETGVDVVKEIVKVSREMFDSSLEGFTLMGKKHNLSKAVVLDMQENYKKSHMIKGSKVDTHLIRIANMQDSYKTYLTSIIEGLDSFNLQLIVDGVVLPKRKRNVTLEYDAQPQLKLVCELLDLDAPLKDTNKDKIS